MHHSRWGEFRGSNNVHFETEESPHRYWENSPVLEAKPVAACYKVTLWTSASISRWHQPSNGWHGGAQACWAGEAQPPMFLSSTYCDALWLVNGETGNIYIWLHRKCCRYTTTTINSTELNAPRMFRTCCGGTFCGRLSAEENGSCLSVVLGLYLLPVSEWLFSSSLKTCNQHSVNLFDVCVTSAACLYHLLLLLLKNNPIMQI